jgi:hypothetical protein
MLNNIHAVVVGVKSGLALPEHREVGNDLAQPHFGTKNGTLPYIPNVVRYIITNIGLYI